jgi:hypothetical protein
MDNNVSSDPIEYDGPSSRKASSMDIIKNVANKSSSIASSNKGFVPVNLFQIYSDNDETILAEDKIRDNLGKIDSLIIENSYELDINLKFDVARELTKKDSTGQDSTGQDSTGQDSTELDLTELNYTDLLKLFAFNVVDLIPVDALRMSYYSLVNNTNNGSPSNLSISRNISQFVDNMCLDMDTQYLSVNYENSLNFDWKTIFKRKSDQRTAFFFK